MQFCKLLTAWTCQKILNFFLQFLLHFNNLIMKPNSVLFYLGVCHSFQWIFFTPSLRHFSYNFTIITTVTTVFTVTNSLSSPLSKCLHCHKSHYCTRCIKSIAVYPCMKFIGELFTWFVKKNTSKYCAKTAHFSCSSMYIIFHMQPWSSMLLLCGLCYLSYSAGILLNNFKYRIRLRMHSCPSSL